jgi:hypothetical protein
VAAVAGGECCNKQQLFSALVEAFVVQGSVGPTDMYYFVHQSIGCLVTLLCYIFSFNTTTRQSACVLAETFMHEAVIWDSFKFELVTPDSDQSFGRNLNSECLIWDSLL